MLMLAEVPSVARGIFEEILEKKLRKIPYLSEVQLDSMAMLSNFGHVLEQEPHRDFSSVKI